MAQTQEGVGRHKATSEALNVAVGQQILDVGCGGGHVLKDLALSVGTDGRVVGLDPSDQQIAAATDTARDSTMSALAKTPQLPCLFQMVNLTASFQYRCLSTSMM